MKSGRSANIFSRDGSSITSARAVLISAPPLVSFDSRAKLMEPAVSLVLGMCSET